MASIRSLSELIRNRLAGGKDVNKDFQIDIREVELAVAMVLGELVKMEYYENIKFADDHSPNQQFIFPYTQIPEKDSDRDEWYVTLPKPYIGLPNGKGVQSVSNLAEPSVTYTPVGSRGRWGGVWSETPAGKQTKRGYYPERNKLFFVNCKTIPKVLVNLLVSDDDDLIIDSGMEARIFDRVMAMFQDRPQDMTNNENKDI